MRLIQHKREARWFYRFVSLGYDRWINPIFWTAAMRDRALATADLRAGQTVLDAGAGSGFTTAGIVAAGPAAADVTMLDQSPHQLANARARPELVRCRKLLGDAEALPFDDDSFDRYVSAGSVEYWPEPARGVAEAYRVTRPGGIATLVGPVRPLHPVARALAETWMLFPPPEDYERWFAAAGFTDVTLTTLAPDWYSGRHGVYAVSVSGTKPVPGAAANAAALGAPSEALADAHSLAGTVRSLARFAAGSVAGAAFVPIGAVLALRARRAARRGR